jgi:hypothetical protein
VLAAGGRALAGAETVRGDVRRPPIRIIGETAIVGESDPILWKSVLDLLPVCPRRIEVLDLDSLSGAARQKLRGLDAFVLPGQATIVVIRQGATLRQAELGDALDRLALASLVWHELARRQRSGRARRDRTGSRGVATIHLDRACERRSGPDVHRKST